MNERRWVLGIVLGLQGCGDDGHVVADMANGGSGGNTTETNGSTSAGGNGGSGPSTGGSGSGSGGSNAATTTGTGGSPSASGGASTTVGGSTGGTGTGGTGTGGTGTGGTGTGGTGTGGTGGGSATGGTGGGCPDGEVWCPGCNIGEGDCYPGGCPGSACPDCSAVDNEADCNARADCHSVFQDPGTCRCATVGCCARFAFCAPGFTADCDGADVACTTSMPFCEGPAFVVSYAVQCYEGCVRPEVCAMTAGSGGSGGSGGAAGEVCPCDADSCPDGEQLCLMGDECVVATGPQGAGICRAADGACFACDCASPETPIATAEGDRPIRDLKVGDLIYSVHESAIRLVPILQTNRVPVRNHRVLRVEFASGAHFEMSGGHPTADGRLLAELAVGHELMGQRITSVREVAYQHPFTYDILPGSDTGSYFADGVLVGSTLHR